MIKLETHLHAIGGSVCADGNSDLTVKKYIDAGYNAVVVTTHYSRNYYVSYPGQSHKEKIDYFFKVYDDFANIANQKGLKTFFGVEVRCLPTNTEYMLIGFDREFLYNNIPLFCYSQQELFALAQKYGLFMYQSHPFRTNVTAGDPKFMHGAESFNGHYHHINDNTNAKKFCEENNLVGLSGTDYHHDDQPITAGIYIPDGIETEKELAKCYFDKNFTLIKEEEKYLTALNVYRNKAVKK